MAPCAPVAEKMAMPGKESASCGRAASGTLQMDVPQPPANKNATAGSFSELVAEFVSRQAFRQARYVSSRLTSWHRSDSSELGEKERTGVACNLTRYCSI